MRRATLEILLPCLAIHNFYPRSPCGERQRGEHHANSQQEFLSTLSLRRATNPSFAALDGASISIHALLAESDARLLCPLKYFCNFYPRSPCGERLNKRCELRRDNRFLSTLSLRRATRSQDKRGQIQAISIHALLAESDDTLSIRIIGFLGFLSTLSLRRATCITIIITCTV